MDFQVIDGSCLVRREISDSVERLCVDVNFNELLETQDPRRISGPVSLHFFPTAQLTQLSCSRDYFLKKASLTSGNNSDRLTPTSNQAMIVIEVEGLGEIRDIPSVKPRTIRTYPASHIQQWHPQTLQCIPHLPPTDCTNCHRCLVNILVM